jgi:hypothetical protein
VSAWLTLLLVAASGPVTETATSTTGPDGDVVVIGEPLPVDENGKAQKAEPPSVDPRPPEGTSPGEAILWGPRILLSPIYFIWEYGLRRPSGWLLTTAEREQWALLVIDFFTFGEKRKSGLIPTVFFDFGFRPNGGLFFFANDAFFDGHNMRINGAYGGSNWYRGAYSSEFNLGGGRALTAAFRVERRPDLIFNGLGPNVLNQDRSRFGRTQVNGELGFRQVLFEQLELSTNVLVEENQFQITDTAFQGRDPSLGTALALGLFPQPAGLEGYFVVKAGVDIRYDSRTNTRKNGTGLTVRGYGRYGADLNDRNRREWFNLGGGLGGHLDLGHNRIIGLGGAALHVFQLGDTDVPFTELPTAGNTPLLLGGFQPGRLIGNSLVAAFLEYRYDVWAMVDGRAFVSVGNVFGENFGESLPGAADGFEVDRLRLSYGVGLASIGDPDQSFNFLIALGHRTFEQGSGIDSVRFLVGIQPDI